MATVSAVKLTKAELRLEQYRRVRRRVATKGTVEQRQEEDSRALASLRRERTAANALIEDER